MSARALDRRRLAAQTVLPGHAAGFSGDGSSLSVPSATALQQGSKITLAFWVYLSALDGVLHEIINKRSGVNATDEWGCQINPTGAAGNPSIQVYASVGSGYILTASSVALAVGWNFGFVQTFGSNPTTQHTSTNNSGLNNTSASSGAVIQGTNPLRFGSLVGDVTPLTGRIDAVGLWNADDTQMGQQAVTDLWNGGAGRRFSTLPALYLTNLVAWWDLDGPKSGFWADASGNGHNLSPTGTVSVVTGIT